jgi:hypothetical protein
MKLTLSLFSSLVYYLSHSSQSTSLIKTKMPGRLTLLISTFCYRLQTSIAYDLHALMLVLRLLMSLWRPSEVLVELKLFHQKRGQVLH